MRMHRDAAHAIPDAECADGALLTAARGAWDEAVDAGERHGYRNAQATVLAPTGTISFLMDCDTTGVEPDFSLVKFKELVGGGRMTIVNKTVPLALQTLGYNDEQIEQIVAYINEHGTIIGAPELNDEHLPVFDVAVGERAISHMGHIKMMGAVQPVISSAISISLQYGVPLETLVQKFSYMRFEPEGMTSNPEIPFAKSMPDYIMRWLASRFLDVDAQEELGILTPAVRARQAAREAASSHLGDTATPAAEEDGDAKSKEGNG